MEHGAKNGFRHQAASADVTETLPPPITTVAAFVMTKPAVFTPVLIACAHAILLVLWLTRPTGALQTKRLDNWQFDRPGTLSKFIAVPLASSTEGGSEITHRLELREFSNASLADAELISFRFEISDAATPVNRLKSEPVRAYDLRLDSPTGGHQFSAPPQTLHSGDLVEMRRTSKGTNAATGTNLFTLSLRTLDPLTFRLRCNGGTASKPEDFRPEIWPGILAIDLPRQANDPANLRRWAFPQGSYATAGLVPPPTRCELLRRWWGFSSQAGWWIGIFLTTVFVWNSGRLWCLPASSTRKGAGTLQDMLAVFSLSAALSVDFALITPPFQGPDEPSHLVSILRWRGNEDNVAEFKAFGSKAHAARLTNRPEQKFAASDLAEPLDWFVFSVEDMDSNVPMRSALAARIWSVGWHLFGTLPLPEMLMAFRLLTALLVSVLISVAAAITSPNRDRALPFALLLLPPSISWFAMTVSNWAFATGLGIVAVASFIRIATGRRDSLAGLSLGTAMGLALQNSATLATWVTGLIVTLVGVTAGSRHSRDGHPFSPARSLAFWGAITFSVNAAFLIGTPEHNALMTKWGSTLLGIPLSGFPWWLLVLGGSILSGLAGFGLELLATKVAGLLRELSLARRLANLPPLLRWLPLTVIVIWQGWIAFNPSPQLPPVKEALLSWEFQARLRLPSMGTDNWEDVTWRLRGWDYVARTVTAVFGSFGLGDHDYLTSVLFWSYLGYNDVWLPDPAISTLILLFVIGLTGWVTPYKRAQPGYDRWIAFWWFTGALCSLVLTACASAFSSFSPSIHGRYLIPFYIMLLGLCAMGAQRHMEHLALDIRKVGTSLLCLILGIHHYCLAFMAHRYF